MKAAMQHTYGAPDVLSLVEVDRPIIGDGDVLVQVHASTVTQGDRRLRAADFPGISKLFGRLMMGIFRPKNPIPGTVFAGKVVAVGSAVTQFAVGDDVFGGCPHSAHAEALSIAEDSSVARMPAGMSYDEAAAVPYGAVTASTFLSDFGKLQRGERVLIVGASGGVGRYAVQLAHHLGAEVTGVSSAATVDLVRSLGADHVVDYATEDVTRNGQRYDLILDTMDLLSFGQCRSSLTPTGRYLSLHIGLRLLFHSLWTKLTGGPRALLGVAFGSRSKMEQVRELVEQGAISPVIDRRYPLAQIADAHRRFETARPHGSVVIAVA